MKNLFILFFGLITTIFSAENPTFLFLRNDVGARATSLGGSFVSMKNDPNGIFYNPALLNSIDKSIVSVGFGQSFIDANYGHFSIIKEIENFGKIGFGVLYQNYGTFKEIDNNENILGDFTSNDLQLIATTSKEIEENLTIGLSSNFIISNLSNYQSTALAFDVGAHYNMPSANPISFGLSILHIGSQLKSYDNINEKLPLDLKAGFTIKPEHLPLLLNFNFHQLNGEQNIFFNRFKIFSIGGEFTLSKVLKFRFGYNNQRRKDLKFGTKSGMAGFSFGGGLEIKNYLIDYSYSSLGMLNAINRITIQTNF